MDGTELIAILSIGIPLVISQVGLWVTYSRAIGRMEGKIDGLDDKVDGNTKRIERLENSKSRRRSG
jgi:hypothetical protein